MTERIYALTHVAAGDYLLPSNDRARLWRIHSYRDGHAYGLQVAYEARKFWRAVWVPWSEVDRLGFAALAVTDPWEKPWHERDWRLPTRAAAVSLAMAVPT